MNNTITAQELKTKGTRALDEKMGKFKEVVVTVRGKDAYVVLAMEQYHSLRECELEAALSEAERDIAKGKFAIKTIERHIKDLKHA